MDNHGKARLIAEEECASLPPSTRLAKRDWRLLATATCLLLFVMGTVTVVTWTADQMHGAGAPGLDSTAGTTPSARVDLSRSSEYDPRGSALNATDLQQWVTSMAGKYSTLTLKTGNYTVADPSASAQHNSHIYLENLADFTLDMQGVHLFLCNRHKTALYVMNLRNVSFIGLSVHYLVATTNQAYLRAIGADGTSLDVQVMDGYPLEEWLSGGAMTCYVFDRVTRWWKEGSSDMYATGATPITGRNAFRLHFSGSVGSDRQAIAVGDLIACRQNGGSFVVHSQNCDCMHWQGIQLFGGPSFGLFEGYEVNRPPQSACGNRYTGCSIRRPEKPANATEGVLLSTSADGFHSSGVPYGPTLDSCWFEAMPDDGIAIHGRYSLVTGAFVKNKSFVVAEPYGHSWYAAGSSLLMYDNQFQPAGQRLAVVGTADISKWYRPPHYTSHMLTKLNLSSCAFIMVTVAEELPASCTFDYIVSCTNRTGNGFVLRNNTVRYHRARGMLIKASNGLIVDNTVEGSTMAGLLMTPELYWGEAGYVDNVTVLNNTFINIGYTVQGVAGIGIGAVDPHHQFAGGYGHSKISIRGNRFINISNTNVWITSASSVVFTDNIFDHPFRHTPWAQCCFNVPHDNMVWLTQSRDIHLANNCMFGRSLAAGKLLNVTTSVSGSGLKAGIVTKDRC